MANTGTLNLLAVLIQLFGQYAPTLVKGISDLVHGNPRQPGETDINYLIRLNGLTEAKLLDASANDAAVEELDKPAPTP